MKKKEPTPEEFLSTVESVLLSGKPLTLKQIRELNKAEREAKKKNTAK